MLSRLMNAHQLTNFWAASRSGFLSVASTQLLLANVAALEANAKTFYDWLPKRTVRPIPIPRHFNLQQLSLVPAAPPTSSGVAKN